MIKKKKETYSECTQTKARLDVIIDKINRSFKKKDDNSINSINFTSDKNNLSNDINLDDLNFDDNTNY